MEYNVLCGVVLMLDCFEEGETAQEKIDAAIPPDSYIEIDWQNIRKGGAIRVNGEPFQYPVTNCHVFWEPKNGVGKILLELEIRHKDQKTAERFVTSGFLVNETELWEFREFQKTKRTEEPLDNSGDVVGKVEVGDVQ